MSTTFNTYRVKDAMSTIVISVGADDTIHEALSLMSQYRVTVLPVTDDRNRCVGVLSTSDLIDPTQEFERERHDVDQVGESARQDVARNLSQDHLGQRQVGEFMTVAVVAVNRETPMLEATGEMLRHRIHHLPVVDDNQKVLGIVSTMDALSVFHRYHAEDGN